MTDQSVMTPKTSLPPSEPAAEKRRAILDAARRLLVRGRFEDLVLDDVAKAAGVAKGTLYLYFKSKDELVAAAFEELVEELGRELQTLLDGELKGEKLLRAAVRTILSHFDRHRDFLSQFTSGMVPGCSSRCGGRMLEKFRRNLWATAEILRKAGPSSGVRTKDFDFAAIALFSLCRSAFMRRLVDGSRSPLAGDEESVTRFFLHGAGA
jgi:AcrR family transcriptional regulator